MAKIKDESNARDDANLPKRQRGASRDQSFGDKEIGSGGQRTRADGVQVNGRDTNDDKGWHTSR
jgi:hypothetical protein